MPTVTVTIPTHNREDLLPNAVDSVLNQTYGDFELIVCDDGSRDRTPDYMASLTDPRIRYLRHPENIGKSNNMRSGFDAAQGKYFIKFDDDDRLTPTFLAATVAVLDQHPQVDFVGTDHWIIDIHNQRDIAQTDANSRKWGRSRLAEGIVEDLPKVTFVDQSFQIGATLFRRSALQDVDYMRPNLQNCEDNDLLVRLAIAGKTGYYLPQRLMEYRVHAGQQGLGRAVRYLSDQVAYLENFRFDTASLEAVRQARLAETQLVLGLRLVESGAVIEGRDYLQQGRSHNPRKAWIGQVLSHCPVPVRRFAFNALRQS